LVDDVMAAALIDRVVHHYHICQHPRQQLLDALTIVCASDHGASLIVRSRCSPSHMRQQRALTVAILESSIHQLANRRRQRCTAMSSFAIASLPMASKATTRCPSFAVAQCLTPRVGWQTPLLSPGRETWLAMIRPAHATLITVGSCSALGALLKLASLPRSIRAQQSMSGRGACPTEAVQQARRGRLAAGGDSAAAFDALDRAAIDLARRDCWELALEAWRAALRIRPRDFTALHNTGLMLEFLGRYREWSRWRNHERRAGIQATCDSRSVVLLS
jgi:hypothetical protein